MDDEAERSRAARRAAERALVRVVHHYGGRPEFVVLGGLVPELLCAGSGYHLAGARPWSSATRPSGTGSGQTLCFFIPIAIEVLAKKRHLAAKRTRAIDLPWHRGRLFRQ